MAGDRRDAGDRRPPGRARLEDGRGRRPGGLRVPRPARLVDGRDRDAADARPRRTRCGCSRACSAWGSRSASTACCSTSSCSPSSPRARRGCARACRFTSSGKGQIQGGLFAFPVGVLIGFAVLTSGTVRSRAAQFALLALVGLECDRPAAHLRADVLARDGPRARRSSRCAPGSRSGMRVVVLVARARARHRPGHVDDRAGRPVRRVRAPPVAEPVRQRRLGPLPAPGGPARGRQDPGAPASSDTAWPTRSSTGSRGSRAPPRPTTSRTTATSGSPGSSASRPRSSCSRSIAWAIAARPPPDADRAATARCGWARRPRCS